MMNNPQSGIRNQMMPVMNPGLPMYLCSSMLIIMNFQNFS